MRITLLLLAVLVVTIVTPGPMAAAERPAVNTGTLFTEMTDMVGLTYFPAPAYKTVQFSSYDRRSRIPGGPDWFANSDGFGGEPVPNFIKVLREPGEDGIGHYLMAEVEGPGAVVRLWTAAISGEINMYLDGSDAPVWSGPAQDFFKKTYDRYKEFSGLDRDLFQKTVYQRDASYAPIPFAEGLKIIWKGKLDTIHFYQIQVRLYENAAEIKTFAPGDLALYRETINRVCSRLAKPDLILADFPTLKNITYGEDVPPGEKTVILDLGAPGALKGFAIKLEAKNRDLALRQTLLHVICDDYPWGQVQSPVGDFFGAAPGVNPYESLPLSQRPDGTMICRYVMPFKKNLKLVLENLGSQTVKASGEAWPIHYDWDDLRSMHFRARWRVGHNMTASNKAVQDLPFILAWGKGVYVGTVSYLLNPSDVPTPYGSWWGEGDEKVFVDGEKHPSTFGTGSEDYYNYSWSVPDIFFFPYCGQPRNDGPGNRGFVTNFRWQIPDRLPFKESIRFYMELYSHERTPGLSYARMAYHYGFPGIHDDHQVITPEDVRELSLPKDWQPAMRMGARNSQCFAAEDCLADKSRVSMVEGLLWAGGKLCVWKPEKTGDRIDYTFKMAEPGKKRINFVAGLYGDSGKVRVWLDGRATKAGKDGIVDLHRPYRTLLRSFRAAELELASGIHTLTLEFVGAPDSVEHPEIGMDFIWVQSVQ
jgi:hypothetical protein